MYVRLFMLVDKRFKGNGLYDNCMLNASPYFTPFGTRQHQDFWYRHRNSTSLGGWKVITFVRAATREISVPFSIIKLMWTLNNQHLLMPPTHSSSQQSLQLYFYFLKRPFSTNHHHIHRIASQHKKTHFYFLIKPLSSQDEGGMLVFFYIICHVNRTISVTHSMRWKVFMDLLSANKLVKTEWK